MCEPERLAFFHRCMQAALVVDHGKNGHTWDSRDLLAWAAFADLEAGQALRSVLDYNNGDFGLDQVLKETAQTAALAFKTWEKARQLIAEGGTA